MDHSKEDRENSSNIEDGKFPSRCPFSGVSFDPSLLKEWESKMKQSGGHVDAASRLQIMHKLVMQQHMNGSKGEDTQPDTEDDESSVLMQKRTTMRRIQITNSQSKRTKDIFLEPSSSHMVWDAIYNNPGVKDANIRKWNSETVQGVKEGTKEIRLEVCSDSSLVSSKVYTLDDLKGLSTEELFKQSLSYLVDSDPMINQEDSVLKLQLCCVDK